jgi:hypothetical protein
LKELAIIYDCYYKSIQSVPEHNVKVAEYIIAQRYNAQDFLRELTPNESLKLFRGLFMMDGVPVSRDCQPIFSLYVDLVELLREQLNLSTWLTVIETARQITEPNTPLKGLIAQAKLHYTDLYGNEMHNLSL